MDSAAYDMFTATLLDNVRHDPDIVGIVFAGSTADGSRRDQWSDHDFLLIVTPGLQEQYRQNLSWLPDNSRIIMAYRETEHGLNVIYEYGHLAEFAVFDLEEIARMKANAYSVPVDKADIRARMADVAQKSVPEPLDVTGAVKHTMQLLFAGAGRYGRGEKLSAHTFVRQWALRRLLMLLPVVLNAPNPEKLDNLDPFRRMERVLPELAAQIEAMLRLDTMDTADAYLNLLQTRVKPRLPGYPTLLHEVARTQIAKARAAQAQK